MTRVRSVLTVVAMTALVGCATTGGSIGNLMPIPLPKVLKGEIKDSVYTTPDKSFSVAVPHKQGSEEYRHMHVKEQINEYGAYVSFGPTSLDQSIYRLETAKRVTPCSPCVKLEDAAPKMIENYRTQIQQGYGGALKEVATRQEMLNGRKAYYWKLTQVIPARTLSRNTEAAVTHEAYVIDFEKGMAMVWVQTPDILRKFAKDPRAFAESVEMH